MKKILILASASAFAFVGANALAATPLNSGVYLGANLGYSQVQTKRALPGYASSVLHKKKNSGFVWNLEGGYKINPYLGLELGYTQYPNQKYSLTIDPTDSIKGQRTYTIDTAVKGILPLQGGFSAFAKLGPAYANQKYKSNLASKSVHRIVPYGAVGAGYSITPNLELTVQGSGSTKSGKVPARWAVTGGATYII